MFSVVVLAGRIINSRGKRSWELGIDSRKHCVAAPFSRLSMVAQTTTLFPLEWTPKPPISCKDQSFSSSDTNVKGFEMMGEQLTTPCFPEIAFTEGASPITLT